MWPGTTMSRGPEFGVDRDLDRVGAVVGRDPGADPAGRLDRDREGGLQRRLVLRRHQVEAELAAALRGQRQADQPARLLGHEVDRLRRRELRRHHQVALVLAVFAVADDDHPAAADLFDRLLDGRERALASCSRRGSRFVSVCRSLGSRSAPFQRMVPAAAPRTWRSMSTSTFSGSPGATIAEVGALQGLGDQRDLYPAVAELGDGEADAVEGDRALVDDVAQQLGGELDPDAAGEAVLGDPR